MNATEVLSHFREAGVLADIPEHNTEHPRFIIAEAPDGEAYELMKPLSDSTMYYENRDRIDSVTEDGVLVSMYVT